MRAEVARLEGAEAEGRGSDRRQPEAGGACSSQIRLDMTRDGLRIQIVDEQNRPMFDSGSAVREALHARAAARDRRACWPTCRTASRSTATPTRSRSPAASAATATGSCRPTAPTRRAASWSPAACPTTACCACRAWRRARCSMRDDPHDPMNRRISIIVMNREAEDRIFRTAPEIAEADQRRRSARLPTSGRSRASPIIPQPPINRPSVRGPAMSHAHRPEVPDRRRLLHHAPHRARPAQGDGLQQRRRSRGRRRRAATC